ncbi:MAG: hypothetical protein HGA66_11060, partial [Holophaga sp.]|nr:hypothetical protein [Holophaga sp.]
MTEALKNLPVLMGAMRQEAVSGELILEHNDGVRTLFISRGELIHLKSDVAGEQFGNYLLRQGILDLASLNELLANDERYRIGEKVIQWGMMNLEERDLHLQALQEQIMIHALEHPVLAWTWHAGPMEKRLEQDLHFKLQHRHFIWNTFQESHYLMDLLTILDRETEWRWEGRNDLVESLSDLPLTPGTAYALSFLGADPISFETFRSLSNLEEEAAGRFIITLWALGALALCGGKLPSVAGEPPEAPAQTPVTPHLAMPPLPLKGPKDFPLIFPPGGGRARIHVPPPREP